MARTTTKGGLSLLQNVCQVKILKTVATFGRRMQDTVPTDLYGILPLLLDLLLPYNGRVGDNHGECDNVQDS